MTNSDFIVRHTDTWSSVKRRESVARSEDPSDEVGRGCILAVISSSCFRAICAAYDNPGPPDRQNTGLEQDRIIFDKKIQVQISESLPGEIPSHLVDFAEKRGFAKKIPQNGCILPITRKRGNDAAAMALTRGMMLWSFGLECCGMEMANSCPSGIFVRFMTAMQGMTSIQRG